MISQDRYEKLILKEQQIAAEEKRLIETVIGVNDEVQAFLSELKSTKLQSGITLANLLKRPEITYQLLAPIDPERKPLPDDVIFEVEINIKYEGYIKRQQQQVQQFKKLEGRRIPEQIDYDDVPSLRIEARQKLSKIRPSNVGQASRISGVSPADISVLLVYLEHYKAGKQ